MGTKLSQKELDIYVFVDDVLFYEWDPIGFSHDPDFPRDEYRGYLPTVYSKLKQAKSTQDISDYLIEIEKERMGFEPTKESIQRASEVAEKLITYNNVKMSEAPDLVVQYGQRMEDYARIVATGTWFYDKNVPKKIKVYCAPAKYSSRRYNEDDELDESSPIPVTPDGLVYMIYPYGGEEYTLEKAKAWADAQPWGPCVWDKKNKI